MPDQTTRRQALVQITAGAAASAALASLSPAALAQATYQPRALTREQFKILRVLVDMIIPATETPGATALGVDRMIDKTLTGQDDPPEAFLDELNNLVASGFADIEESDRVKLLEEYSQAAGEKGDFFQILKDLTVDHYYSTEVGLIDELGYEGNTALNEFPGCTHEEHR
ncbi:MAG: gluconate 2-dehydrogenase subunit 3 family protein [Acidobacteria bacterium]|nr:gluconate 2-dehydrogenase subunit 3 family protein [Acidobacteriota bacterium]